MCNFVCGTMSCAMSLVSYTLSADLSDTLGLVQKRLLVAIRYCNVTSLVCEWSLEFGPSSETSCHRDYSLLLIQEDSYRYGFLFNCTTMGQASDSMTALT